jgi:hypothetical protein
MRGHYVSTRQRCVVGNEARRAALTSNAGLWEDREREEVHSFAAATYGTAPRRLGPIARRADIDRLASALVHPGTGVLGCDDQFPQTYWQVELILSAMRLSRRWEEGLWHAS